MGIYLQSHRGRQGILRCEDMGTAMDFREIFSFSLKRALKSHTRPHTHFPYPFVVCFWRNFIIVHAQLRYATRTIDQLVIE